MNLVSAPTIVNIDPYVAQIKILVRERAYAAVACR
jgi:hypothetical protein